MAEHSRTRMLRIAAVSGGPENRQRKDELQSKFSLDFKIIDRGSTFRLHPFLDKSGSSWYTKTSIRNAPAEAGAGNRPGDGSGALRRSFSSMCESKGSRNVVSKTNPQMSPRPSRCAMAFCLPLMRGTNAPYLSRVARGIRPDDRPAT